MSSDGDDEESAGWRKERWSVNRSW